MVKFGAVAGVLGKKYGDKQIRRGNQFVDFERLSTGIFPFDLALGGGFPQGKMHELRGPESSGKTTLCLCMVALQQKLQLEKQFVWIDAEHSFDSVWAARLGVDLERLHVLTPLTGEQGVDFMEAATSADDVHMIVLDSIAALAPTAEIEGNADRQQVGGNSQLVGRMMRKCMSNLITLSHQEAYPTILFINQIRFKVGVQFGNPETSPGGKTRDHYCNIIARIYGSDVIKKDVSEANPAVKDVTVSLKKWRCPIVGKTTKFSYVLIPHEDYEVGQSSWVNTTLAYMKKYGLLVKGKSKWEFGGQEYKTQQLIIDLLTEDVKLRSEVQAYLIKQAVLSENAIPPQEDV
ncbi:MAG: hypothetical protein GWN00_01230 [Aliifodinibius sp.]|nr:DNA recombination/repair protein RecA [Fodinibius sp.]NIV09954.1 hypothetical protein [Fodinibius sp.]NIY23484.1 hypothetical protein [Fodinibius sp.]